MKISDHFQESPFAKIAGRLSPTVGQQDFVSYSVHRELREIVEKSFSSPITFRLVYGQSGEGKTWTLAWLWRELAKKNSKTMVLGVPRFEIRKAPERVLVESVVASFVEQYGDLIHEESIRKNASDNLQAIHAYLQDPDARNALRGKSGSPRVPKVEGQTSLSMNQTGDLQVVFFGIAELARAAGYERLLVLVDELESPFTLQPKKNISIFSDFLRDLYDFLETDSASRPKIQLLFAGTFPVLAQFDPRAIGKQIEEGGVMGAFLRRTKEPFLLRPPTEPEVKTIASDRIEAHRKRKEGKFIPYEEKAVTLAWQRSGNNLGQYVRILQAMYDRADGRKASEITVADCEAVTEEKEVEES